MSFESVVLEGTRVRLEPLCESHRSGLCDAIRDGELWRLFVTLVPHPDNLDRFYAQAKDDSQAGLSLVFATIDKQSGKVVGSSRFMLADFNHKKVEIGFTFLARSAQRSAINTEAKLLMLSHAFEVLEMNRVEFLTDFLNHTSRRAILRLGAKEEGVIRQHRIMPNGRVRDSVLFSILKHEWPGVKENLLFKLGDD